MLKLSRPPKWRKVEFIPDIKQFIPCDKSVFDKNILLVEEIEAIRLKDIEKLEQEECAEKMEISRQTFQRILNNAREKIADSIINGKAISIEGGNYTRNICFVHCNDCDNQWKINYENIVNKDYKCPNCKSDKLDCKKVENKRCCRGICKRNNENC